MKNISTSDSDKVNESEQVDQSIGEVEIGYCNLTPFKIGMSVTSKHFDGKRKITKLYFIDKAQEIEGFGKVHIMGGKNRYFAHLDGDNTAPYFLETLAPVDMSDSAEIDGYDQMKEEMIGAIVGLRSRLESTNLPYFRSEANRIITTEVTDVNSIGRILDEFLDMMLWGVGEEEFERLVSYLATFDEKTAQAYRQFLDKQDSDEDPECSRRTD